jgi:hypothetical protein
MAQLTHEQYNRLEAALSGSRRIRVSRRGIEYVLVPLAIRTHERREVIDTRHPTTGDAMTLFLDELDFLEVV